MREGGDLYFAPGVRFADVTLDDVSFVNHLRDRINGFYLEPARLCVAKEHAFAAGLLLVSTIDFLARLHLSAEELTEQKSVGSEFQFFVRRGLPSFESKALAQKLYYDFRNGLSHEARIKNAGEFSFEKQQTVCVVDGRLCVNPRYLLIEVETALTGCMRSLSTNLEKRTKVAVRLREHFGDEFELVERGRAV